MDDHGKSKKTKIPTIIYNQKNKKRSPSDLRGKARRSGSAVDGQGEAVQMKLLTASGKHVTFSTSHTWASEGTMNLWSCK